MLQLILGGAGSGKSTRLTEYIAADVAAGKRAWLIIPEQQANLSERTMLPKLPTNAGLTFTIAGFTRLAREVARQYGGETVPVPQGLCSLVMWQNLRELSGMLTEYQTVSLRSDAKLTDLLRATVEELRADAITPSMLENTADQLPDGDALRKKLYDLALIYAAYDRSMAEALDGHSGDEVAHLASLLEKHNYFSGGHVYIDSFTDFTAEEYKVLRHILKQADRVTVSLCCDGKRSYDPSFESVNDTLKRIKELAEKEHVSISPDVVLKENYRATTDELRALERHLWNFSLKKDDIPTPTTRDSITLLRSTNIYAEAEATALHILDLVHHGARFGDMAVIVRDSETYRGVLDAAFERYHIPFYFSEKTTLSEKPLSRLLLSALRAVARDWQTQDILTMLRTGLCPVTSYEVDLFEQYVSTWKISGAAFAAEVWTRNPDGYADEVSARGAEILRAANHVREVIMTPLLRLYASVSKGGTLPALCAALYELMQQLGIAERCAALAQRELSAGYLKQAGETVRVFDTVCMTLTQISARMPALSLDVEEFSTVLRMIFDQTEIASVPSLHDSVTVGSAATLRVENVTVGFVLGLCEGEFPGSAADTGLLSDAEKQRLTAMGLPLDYDRNRQSSRELLYVWRAMTKPSEHLFASTVRADTDGKEKSPSVAYNRLLYLFPYLEKSIRDFDLSMIVPRKDTPAPAPLPDENEGEQAVEQDALYQPLPPSPNDPSPEIMARYFGDTLWLSQSRIQTFVQCPYRFYCRYPLSLREKTEARLDYADSGTFIHYVLDHFMRKCLDKDGALCLPSEENVELMADDIVNEFLRSLAATTPTDLRTLHAFRRLRALTLVLLRDILNELAHSKFRPKHFELDIGSDKKDAPPPYEITLRDGKRILLGGKVDRVDCYKKDGSIYLRVIDYKSSAKNFSIDDVRKGLNLQLLIYLFSLCRRDDTLPAGALYLGPSTEKERPVPHRAGLLLNDADILEAMSDQWDPNYLAGIKKNKDNKLTGSALTEADQLTALERDICETIRRIGEDMLRGRAARTPSEDACRFCPMRDGCPDAVRG